MSRTRTCRRDGRRAALARLRARLGDERGSLLIEVMVGAIVLAIATVAIMNGLDGAQGTGARNKARSVAAALAEQDQDRMRSIPTAQLMRVTPQTRTVRVRGVDYTVKSSSNWAVDQGGVVSCANNSRTAANLRIVSEVSSPLTRGVVDEASLVTPPPGTFGPNQGRLIVKLLNRDQEPMQGMPVALSGTAPYTETTNALGCAVFQFITAGDYQATVGGTGLVNWDGETPVREDTTVTAGTSTTLELEVDAPAKLNVSFQTKVGPAAAVASESQWLSVANGKTTPSPRVFASTTGAPTTLITAENLFPFTDGYGVYAGRCEENNPERAPTNSPPLLPHVTPGRGQEVTVTPRIWTPSINIQVIQAGGTAISGAPVIVKPADPQACDAVYPTGTTNASGALVKPGFPYGSYKLCAQAIVSGLPRHAHADQRTGSGSGSFDSRSTSSYQTETSTNLVDDTIRNIVQGGNNPSASQNGAIRLRLNRHGGCH